MGEAGTSAFKFGIRPPARPRCIVAGTGEIEEITIAGKYFHDVSGIIFPVGGDKDAPAILQAFFQQPQKYRVDQAPFVMALLGPRVWEKNINLVQAFRREQVAQDIGNVMIADAYIREVPLGNPPQQAADTGAVYLNGQEIIVPVCAGQCRRRFSHARADVQNLGRVSLK